MTEKKLWLYAAQLFDKPAYREIKDRQTPYVVPTAKEGDFCFGLCRFLVLMRDHHDISAEAFLAANRHLASELGKLGWMSTKSGYAFPLTKEGAGQRADFCRQLAKGC